MTILVLLFVDFSLKKNCLLNRHKGGRENKERGDRKKKTTLVRTGLEQSQEPKTPSVSLRLTTGVRYLSHPALLCSFTNRDVNWN